MTVVLYSSPDFDAFTPDFGQDLRTVGVSSLCPETAATRCRPRKDAGRRRGANDRRIREVEDDTAGYTTHVGEKRRIVAFLQIDFNFTVLEKGNRFLSHVRRGPVGRCPARALSGAHRAMRFFFFCFPQIKKIYRRFLPGHTCVHIRARWPTETMLCGAEKKNTQITWQHMGARLRNPGPGRQDAVS